MSVCVYSTELLAKHGGPLHPQTELEDKNLDNLQILECLKHLSLETLKTDFIPRTKELIFFSKTSSKVYSIDKILELAEKLQIIEEDPIKHRDKNKIEDKLEIIDENIKIRIAKIKDTNQDIEDINIQIKELFDLKSNKTIN